MRFKQDISSVLTTVFSSLQIKNFRYFWCGQCVSLIGTWTQRTAQVWLVYTLTDSPLLVGLIGVCQFMPMLFFSLFAGVIVDRFTAKKIILVWTQGLFMLQAILFTILTYTGVIRYWHVFILAAFFGVLQTFDMPARQSFFNELVGKEHIMNAVSLNSTIVNVARIIGPAIAGFIMVNFGMVTCFFINVLSFLAVLTSLFFIHQDKQVGKGGKRHKNLLPEMQAGLNYIHSKNELWIMVLIMAIFCTFAYNTEVINPIFANEVLQGGSAAFTALMSAAGAGALVGAVFMSARAVHGINKKLLLTSIITIVVVEIGLYFVTNKLLAIVLLAIIGFSNIVFMNMANAVFQINADAKYRGRAMSVYAFLNQGSTPLGNFFAGSFMEHFGGIWGYPACGIGILLCFVSLHFWQGEKVRDWFAG